ncbi:MAG: class I tRNA ligase family protein, partial [Eggerthellaceae bacterium]|nr:class I tRNA ligase family protein [Eggerthellaceae bacterium]
FSGMTRDEARKAVVAWFEEHDLLERIDDLNHSVMHCYRCDSALEPWLSEQWFVAVDSLKQPAIDVVKNGEVTFHPKRWENTYTTWMENLKDWCISRQLWWGHRIPVFYCDACGWHDALMEDVDICPSCGAPVRQDEDVLDTWFSSQLWTFATQGWPDNLNELSQHHPTKVLVTARDIIALWVARMVMSSLYFTKQIPFEDVFIYATILAKDGSRMSKSKGNGVDPMDLISMYGADAMRYNLLTLVTNNQDVRFDADLAKDGSLKGSPRTDAARSFVTKIWNAARFVQMNLDGYILGEPAVQTPADAWIFSRLAKLVSKVTKGLEGYHFGEVTRDVYEFFWNELCDWYIEFSKLPLRKSGEVRLQAQRNLIFVFDVALRLLHPILPFVTEAIWQHIPHITESEVVMVAPWPNSDDFNSYINEAAEHQIDLVIGVVGTIRSVRARYMLSPKADIKVYVQGSQEDIASLEAQRDLVMYMAHISSVTFNEQVEKPTPCSAARVAGCEIFCALEGLIDIEVEKARVEKALTQTQKELASIQKKLDNPQFLAKAAPEIVEKDKHNAAELSAKVELLTSQLEELR